MMAEVEQQRGEVIGVQSNIFWTVEIHRRDNGDLETHIEIRPGLKNPRQYAGFAMEFFEQKDREGSKKVRAFCAMTIAVNHTACSTYELHRSQQPSWLLKATALEFSVSLAYHDGTTVEDALNRQDLLILSQHPCANN
jgi:hypothetical protein